MGMEPDDPDRLRELGALFASPGGQLAMMAALIEIGRLALRAQADPNAAYAELAKEMDRLGADLDKACSDDDTVVAFRDATFHLVERLEP